MQKHNSTLSDRLSGGLRSIQNSKLALPLVPLGGNKQPLGDKWQNRPFTAEQLIEALATGGVSVLTRVVFLQSRKNWQKLNR